MLKLSIRGWAPNGAGSLFAGLLFALAGGLAPQMAAAAATEFYMVEGTVAYRERIAMPPGAVLEVSVLDVSLMDAPAKVMARSQEAFAGRQVPIPFALKVRRDAVVANHRYTVQARILLDGQLRFITTQHNPVLTEGTAGKLDLLLQGVQASPEPKPAAAASPKSELGLQLPASFTGVVPCADCSGIAQTLTLRSDGLFRLRSVYLGKPGAPFSQQGRWFSEGGGAKLRLQMGDESQWYAVKRPRQSQQQGYLTQLDRQGQPIASTFNYDLRPTTQLDAISESLAWRGELVYQADAAQFTDCATGLRWPVLMAGDFARLSAAYAQQRNAPGTPLMVSLQARLLTDPARQSGDGPVREHLLVDKFTQAHAGQRCGVKPPAEILINAAPAALIGTYWKLLELKGQQIAAADNSAREVQITLQEKDQRVSGFSGCNRLLGGYQLNGEALKFSQLAGTLMACVPPAMVLEQQVHAALGAARAYRIQGQTLELLEGQTVLARFEAVYLR